MDDKQLNNELEKLFRNIIHNINYEGKKILYEHLSLNFPLPDLKLEECNKFISSYFSDEDFEYFYKLNPQLNIIN